MISGKLIDIEEPFPLDHSEALYHWLSVSGTVSSVEGFPATPASAEAVLADSRIRKWAIWSKQGDLVGAVMFELIGRMGGKAYAVADRSIWGYEMIDEAAVLGMDTCFRTCPDLDYIMGFVISSNWAARRLNERIGMVLKNIIPECVNQRGKMRDMMIFEMTRERFYCQKSQAA